MWDMYVHQWDLARAAGLPAELTDTELIIGSPRFLVAKDGVLTAAWGGWFLISLHGRWPLTFRYTRPLLEGRQVYDRRRRRWAPPIGQSCDQLWERSPCFRRVWKVTTLIWGVALLVDAAARGAMAYTLPVDSVPGLSAALWIATLVLLQIITNLHFLRSGLWDILLNGPELASIQHEVDQQE